VRILVVEDEQKVANALKEGLEGERYDVTLASTGEDAFFQVNTAKFDMILLDWMLPGRDGIQVLTTIRKRGLETPVLLLTARDGLEDRVHGLNSGADDYLVKPFAFAELLRTHPRVAAPWPHKGFPSLERWKSRHGPGLEESGSRRNHCRFDRAGV
jgi:DNA-binding response OmpR family regulator